MQAGRVRERRRAAFGAVRPRHVARSLLIAPSLLIALSLLAAACGGPGTSGAPGTSGGPGTSVPPTGAAGGASPGSASLPTIPPNGGPACIAAGPAIAFLGQVEDALRNGTMTDGFAESQILGVQQALVDQEQVVGLTSPLGAALQGVVSALGELGVLLSQNRPITDLEGQLVQVNATVGTLATACAAG